MKKNNLKSKTIGMTLKSLAFALGLVATTGTTSLAMPVAEETKNESHDHEHNHDIEVENTVVTVDSNNNINDLREFKTISIKEIKNTSITNYKGCSIVEALNLCGINSSFSNRKLIASNLGIKNYRGTSAQNIQLLNMLKNNQIDTLAKVSDIKTVCKDLFGKDAKNVIDSLKLPKTTNITKAEFARIIRQIAVYKNVDTSTYDNKLGLVLNVINDVDLSNQNANDIAWSYYMGYTDIDEKLNYNGNKNLSVSELNLWINSFVNDYNTSVVNNNMNNNGLVLVPSQDKYDRDRFDNSKINSIRNPKIVETNNDHHDDSNDDKEDSKDDKDEKHTHKYGKWKYYNEEKEISTCKECGETKYRKHKLADEAQVTYESNNDATHKVTETLHCNGCNYDFIEEYNVQCDLSTWVYNQLTKLEERECNDCDYEETREHEHEQAPTNLVYVLDKSNNNGTHKLKATYECDVCEEEITLHKDENCELGNWEYNKETGKDERDCDVCDYEETRDHEHEQAPTYLVYVLDKSNNNGTHKLKATYECDICEEEITLHKDENCDLGNWEYNKETGKEERDCDVCDYEETREHEHEQAPSDLVYTFDQSNSDGTHRMKATYECDICEEQITLYKNENCEYGPWEENDGFTCKEVCEVCDYENVKNHDMETVANSVTTNPTIGVHNETKKCNDCGYEEQVEVSCTPDGNMYYHIDGDIVTERENCSICNDICKDDPHNHTYGDYVSVDDDNHMRTCDCGKESVEAHSYSSWEVTSEGVNSRECGDCGHVQTVSHTCDLTTDDVYPSTKTGDYCYERVTTCTAGCDHESRVQVGHDYFVESSSVVGTVYKCSNCGYSYEEEFDFSFLLLNDNSDIYNKELELEEKSKVKRMFLV